MNPRRGRTTTATLVALVSMTAGLVLAAGPAGALVTTVGGGAFGERVTGATSSGPLPSVTLPPSGGGPFTASANGVDLGLTLKTGALSVSTQGGGLGTLAGFAESSATVANVVIANLVKSAAVSSQCRSENSGSTGTATFTGLRVGGAQVTVTVNTRIVLAGAEVYLNEQVRSDTATLTSITVNALRVVRSPGTAQQQEVIVGQSRCQLTRTTRHLIWDPATEPVGHLLFQDSFGLGVELAVRFTADVDGSVTGVRFYKNAAMTGTHTGHLWAVDGTLLASGVFSETASGWQEVTFASPVPVIAGVTYVAGYYAPDERYIATTGWLFPTDRPFLNAVGSAFTYGPVGTFPGSSSGANFWVDVVLAS